jgi:hypothetical protein
MARNYHQGFYTTRNPQKYVGDVNNIVYRSSWELKAFRWCDMNSSVIAWNSEETVVPYFNELDGKMHRYFVDLVIRIKTGDGIRTFLVEIKPEAQVRKPIPPKRVTKKSQANHLAEIDTWICNQQKWKAAEIYAKQKGWSFKILTEHELQV